MIENARRGGQQVGVEIVLEKEKYNGRNKEQGWYRDGETETFSKSNTSLELPEGHANICGRALNISSSFA
jgi:hypothetical protein